jgi:hypothetical protein
VATGSDAQGFSRAALGRFGVTLPRAAPRTGSTQAGIQVGPFFSHMLQRMVTVLCVDGISWIGQTLTNYSFEITSFYFILRDVAKKT